jgi:hypothetical protein
MTSIVGPVHGSVLRAVLKRSEMGAVTRSCAQLPTVCIFREQCPAAFGSAELESDRHLQSLRATNDDWRQVQPCCPGAS